MESRDQVRRVRVIDSHTEGEPTRVVVAGGPDLGAGDAAARLGRMRDSHDAFRSAVVNEPRGFDAMVGALLGEPAGSDAVAQVISELGWHLKPGAGQQVALALGKENDPL